MAAAPDRHLGGVGAEGVAAGISDSMSLVHEAGCVLDK